MTLAELHAFCLAQFPGCSFWASCETWHHPNSRYGMPAKNTAKWSVIVFDVAGENITHSVKGATPQACAVALRPVDASTIEAASTACEATRAGRGGRGVRGRRVRGVVVGGDGPELGAAMTDRCGFDESLELRAEVERLRKERDDFMRRILQAEPLYGDAFRVLEELIPEAFADGGVR